MKNYVSGQNMNFQIDKNNIIEIRRNRLRTLSRDLEWT